jgi:hypothetical protein
MSSTARLKENDGHLGSKIIPDWLSRDEIQNGNLIHLFSSFLFLAFFPPYISAEENTQNSGNAIKGLPPLWLWPQNASVCWTFNQIFTRTKTKKERHISTRMGGKPFALLPLKLLRFVRSVWIECWIPEQWF